MSEGKWIGLSRGLKEFLLNCVGEVGGGGRLGVNGDFDVFKFLICDQERSLLPSRNIN